MAKSMNPFALFLDDDDNGDDIGEVQVERLCKVLEQKNAENKAAEEEAARLAAEEAAKRKAFVDASNKAKAAERAAQDDNNDGGGDRWKRNERDGQRRVGNGNYYPPGGYRQYRNANYYPPGGNDQGRNGSYEPRGEVYRANGVPHYVNGENGRDSRQPREPYSGDYQNGSIKQDNHGPDDLKSVQAGDANGGETIEKVSNVQRKENVETNNKVDAEKPDGVNQKLLTLAEYEKIKEEERKAKAKALDENKLEVRKVENKEFEAMQQLSLKKGNDEVFIKLGSDKDGGKHKNEGRGQKAEKDFDKDAEKLKVDDILFKQVKIKLKRPPPPPRGGRKFNDERSQDIGDLATNPSAAGAVTSSSAQTAEKTKLSGSASRDSQAITPASTQTAEKTKLSGSASHGPRPQSDGFKGNTDSQKEFPSLSKPPSNTQAQAKSPSNTKAPSNTQAQAKAPRAPSKINKK